MQNYFVRNYLFKNFFLYLFLGRMDFDPIYSRYLAYPNENTVVILNTSDWNQKSILTCDAIEFSYSIVQFSPCGNFIAAASEKGDIAVWDIANQSLVDATIHPKSISICALAWNPLGNGEIAFCDTQGQLGIVINCTKRDKEINCGNIENIVESNDIDFEDVQFEDNDEDNENAVSLEKLKNEIMGSDLNKEIDSSKCIVYMCVCVCMYMYVILIIIIFLISASYSLSPTPRPITPETPLQPPFMPSSTPEHLNPRYMCWNEVGVIRCYDSTEDSESSKSIEVEFHDSNFHNSIMMQNYQNYTMGTLSFSALVVANCNQLNIVPLTSGTKDWSLTLEEEKEEIICIGCSSELVCFATNKNFVRVFGIYGTQRAIFSIPGPLVTLNAFKNFIFLGYHSSSPRKGDQCINFMLVNTARLSLKCKYLPGTLSPESNLYWLGFSDVGTPCLMDSCGIFHMYLLQSSVWIPFCDTTKQKKSLSENFFVVAITESMQTIRGIRCRGSMYPGFTPRPTQSEIKIQPPFIEISTDKSQMEAELFTWENLQIEQTEKKIKETSLKTFALACKNNLDQRALEFIQLLENEELLMLAMKYVSKMNKGRLAEKLMEVASKLKIGEDEDSIAEEENKYKKIETNKEKFFTPSSKLNGGKVVLSSGKIKRRERIEKPGGNKKIGEKEKLLNTEKITEKENLKERKINASMEESICSVSSLSVANEDSSFNKCLNESNSSNVSGINLINEEEPKKPFLKSLKKPTDIGYNPLSLTDEYAGFVLEKEVDKRKKPDTEGEKQKEKQRKLDKFMFSKRN